MLERAHRLVAQQYELYNDTIMPALAKQNIVIINHAQRTAEQRAWLRDYVQREVKPLLAPIGLDPSHPFPQVLNKSLNFIMQLEGKDAFGRPSAIAILKVPRVLPRVIPLPAKLAPGKQAFVLLTSAIRAHLQDLFPGREISGFSQFRVTRDSDLTVDEREVHNLRQAMRMELTQRHFGNAVRLEILRTCPLPLQQLLQEQFQIPERSGVSGRWASQSGPSESVGRFVDAAEAALAAVCARLAAQSRAELRHVRSDEAGRHLAAPSVRKLRAGH